MRKLCSFAIPCCAAIFAAVYLLPERALFPAAVFCALGALACLPLRGEARLRVNLLALGLSAGLAWTAVYGLIFSTGPRWLDGTAGRVEATVDGWPAAARYGTSVMVRLHTGRGPDVKTLVYAADEGFLALRPGDGVAFEAKLRLADTSYGEKTDYYRSRGIYLIANAAGAPEARPAGRTPLRYLPTLAARALRESVGRCFDETTAPLITALLTGDKTALPGGLYSDLRRAGLAHTVAVSGLHVNYLVGFVTLLLGRYRRRTAVAGVVLLAFFAAVAGGTPSVLRAVFLQSLLLLAPLLGREYDAPTALSAGLLALLLCNPYAAASVSLQLSFAAVAGIYLVADPLCGRWTERLPAKPGTRLGRLGVGGMRVLLSGLAASLGALLFTTPLTALYFGSISLIAPVSNLLCLWAVSLAFLGGLITALLGLVCPAAGAALALASGLPARFLAWAASRLARFPFAAAPLDGVYLRAWLALVYGVALAYLPRRAARRRPVVPLCCCGAALCAALLFTAAAGSGGALTVTVLDVGQGESVLFASGGRTALVDCGGTGRADPGDTAADYVQSLGLSRLDLLILTHCHADHAGGVPRLLSRLAVDTLLLPEAPAGEDGALRQEILAAAGAAGTRVVLVREDRSVTLGQARLNVYAPLGAGSTNEEGLSVLCTRGDFDALVTGDMDASVEAELVRRGALPRVELLVAGHHGAATSTSDGLLEAIRPEYAAISVGYNTYGHPAYEVLSRLDAYGCRIYRTDWMGNLRFTIR